MKISLSNLVRLQEAATSPYDTPPEADQTVEDKDKKKEDAGKAAYAERAVKTADEYGGYAPPAAIEIKPEDQERWGKLARARGTDINIIRAEEINAAAKAQREARAKQEEEKRQQSEVSRYKTYVGNVSKVQKSFTGKDVDPTQYTRPDRTPDWSRTMNEFGEATDKLIRAGYGKKDPTTGHMVLGLDPNNPQHAQAMKETVFEVREEKADKKIKEVEDYNKLIRTLKTLNPEGKYDHLKEYDPKQFYQELSIGRKDETGKDITYRAVNANIDKSISDTFGASQQAARKEMAALKEAEKAARAAAAAQSKPTSPAATPSAPQTKPAPGQAPATTPSGQPAGQPGAAPTTPSTTTKPSSKPGAQPAGQPATQPAAQPSAQAQSGAWGGGQASAGYSKSTPAVSTTPELLAANLGAFSFGTPGANAKQMAALMYKTQTTDTTGGKKETKETGLSSASAEYASAYSEKEGKKGQPSAATRRGAIRPVGVKGNKGYESQLVQLSESVRFAPGEIAALNEKRSMTPAQASVIPGSRMLADIDFHGLDLPAGIMDTLKGAYKSVLDFGSKAAKTAGSIAMVPPQMRFATRVQDVGLTPKSAKATVDYFSSGPGMVAALANLAGDKEFAASIAGAGLLKAAGAGRLGKYGSKLGAVGGLLGGSELVSRRVGRDIASMIDIRIPGMIDSTDTGKVKNN